MKQIMDGVASFRRFVLSVAGKLQWLPPTLTRICVGWLFLQSGWGKLHHLPDFIDFFKELGIPMPEYQAPFVAGVEFVCGTLILVGLLTRLASVPLIITMIVAIVTARRADYEGIASLSDFVEYLYMLLLLWLGAFGPGPFSLDRLLAPVLERRAA